MNLKAEVKERPIFALSMAVITTAIISFGSSTFATIGYVNSKHQEGISYFQERYKLISEDASDKHSDIKKDISDLKETMQYLNDNIIKLYQRGKK